MYHSISTSFLAYIIQRTVNKEAGAVGAVNAARWLLLGDLCKCLAYLGLGERFRMVGIRM